MSLRWLTCYKLKCTCIFSVTCLASSVALPSGTISQFGCNLGPAGVFGLDQVCFNIFLSQELEISFSRKKCNDKLKKMPTICG